MSEKRKARNMKQQKTGMETERRRTRWRVGYDEASLRATRGMDAWRQGPSTPATWVRPEGNDHIAVRTHR